MLSGLLLAAAFPPLEWNYAAWVALVPIISAVRFVDRSGWFRMGLLCGVVFWLISISWLTHVTVIGWLLLALYCSLYTIPFVFVAGWWLRRYGVDQWRCNLMFMIVGPVVWSGSEYLRSIVCTGFPWNLLGVSQYRNIPLIQSAQWGGVHALSALIVLMNIAAACTLLRYLHMRRRTGRLVHPELMAACLVLVLTMAGGIRAIRDTDGESTRSLRAALIQPNIPQDQKWTPDAMDEIHARLKRHTESALRAGELDLIIWPETSMPDYIRYSEKSSKLVLDLATNGVPLLVGSMDILAQDEGPHRHYNSAFLFAPDGRLLDVYDKQHLVLLGEYIPFERWLLPFISSLAPIEGSFTPGTNATIFKLEGPDLSFASLICFEDTVPSLARKAVLKGATLLINQTNDGWFDPSSGSKQHMIHCVFRCVENRVPALRCTNTGVTCMIDRFGRVAEVLYGPEGHTLVEGFKIMRVDVPVPDRPFTFYTRYGDLWGICSAGATLLLLMGIACDRIPKGFRG